MNNILLPVLIVWMLTMLVWYMTKRTSRWRICPICVGVSGAWLVLSAGIVWGFFSPDFKLPVAMLMGGTVVGIAFQAEKVFKSNVFYLKPGIIIVGMAAAYFLFINLGPVILLVDIVVLLATGYFLFIKPTVVKYSNSDGASDLEEKLKNCC
jgi:hypothetical protein